MSMRDWKVHAENVWLKHTLRAPRDTSYGQSNQKVVHDASQMYAVCKQSPTNDILSYLQLIAQVNKGACIPD